MRFGGTLINRYFCELPFTCGVKYREKYLILCSMHAYISYSDLNILLW